MVCALSVPQAYITNHYASSGIDQKSAWGGIVISAWSCHRHLGPSLILCTRPLGSPPIQNRFVSQILKMWHIIRHICTYFNAFFMVIPNIVTKFQNFDIFENFVTTLTCGLLTPAAWNVLITDITKQETSAAVCDNYEFIKTSFLWMLI